MARSFSQVVWTPAQVSRPWILPHLCWSACFWLWYRWLHRWSSCYPFRNLPLRSRHLVQGYSYVNLVAWLCLFFCYISLPLDHANLFLSVSLLIYSFSRQEGSHAPRDDPRATRGPAKEGRQRSRSRCHLLNPSLTDIRHNYSSYGPAIRICPWTTSFVHESFAFRRFNNSQKTQFFESNSPGFALPNPSLKPKQAKYRLYSKFHVRQFITRVEGGFCMSSGILFVGGEV